MGKQQVKKPGGDLFGKLQKEKSKKTSKKATQKKTYEDEDAVAKLQAIQNDITSGTSSDGNDKTEVKNINKGGDDGSKNESISSTSQRKDSKLRKLEGYMIPNIIVKSETQVTVKVGESIHSFLDRAVTFYNMGSDKGQSKVYLQDLINNILEEWMEKNKPLVKQMQIDSLND